MKKKHIRLIALLILIAILVLLATFNSLLTTYIFNPAILLLWTIRGMIASIPQNVYWAALVVVCILLTIWLMPPKKDKKTSTAYRYQYKPPNRFEYWRTNFAESRLGKNERKFLQENLKELHDSILEMGEKTSLPPDAKQYLFEQEETQKSLWFLLPKALRQRATHRSNQPIHELLEWMEKELEITNDD